MAAKLTHNEDGTVNFPDDIAKELMAIGRKFGERDDDYNTYMWMQQDAQEYARGYLGGFSYMVAMRRVVEKPDYFTRKQLFGVLNCMRNDYLSNYVSKRTTQQPLNLNFSSTALALSPEGTIAPVIADGKYTATHLNSEHTTFSILTIGETERAEMASKGFNVPSGTQRAAYLFGQDNQLDYKGCAFIIGTKVQMFRAFKHSDKLRDTLEYLVEGTVEQRHDLGVKYATISGNCYICDRELTNDISIARGIGPICAKRIGLDT